MILVGEEETKRTEYMRRAASEEGEAFSLVRWSQVHGTDDIFQKSSTDRHAQGAAVKLDPPLCQDTVLQDNVRSMEDYCGKLAACRGSGQVTGQEDAGQGGSLYSRTQVCYLNEPEGILQLLDKQKVKQVLDSHTIPATKMYKESFLTAGELLMWMKSERVSAVFIKPRYFSGAAGVTAFRCNPATGRMIAYTSCCLEEGRLINTKHLYSLSKEEEILPLLDCLLAIGCIVERWHGKDVVRRGRREIVYDLRVVWQFGHIAYLVARGSAGPITNLHLNNGALPVEELGLSDKMLQEVEQLCREAVSCFEGIRVAGIDVLLEKGSHRPLIIEMNGQGDLIYQDIYDKNSIYKEQIKWLRQHSPAGDMERMNCQGGLG